MGLSMIGTGWLSMKIAKCWRKGKYQRYQNCLVLIMSTLYLFGTYGLWYMILFFFFMDVLARTYFNKDWRVKFRAYTFGSRKSRFTSSAFAKVWVWNYKFLWILWIHQITNYLNIYRKENCKKYQINLWEDQVFGYYCGDAAANWLTNFLKVSVKLLFKSDEDTRIIYRNVPKEIDFFPEVFYLCIYSCTSIYSFQKRI